MQAILEGQRLRNICKATTDLSVTAARHYQPVLRGDLADGL